MIAQQFAATVLIFSSLLVPTWAVGQDNQRALKVPTAELESAPGDIGDRGILLQDFGLTIAASSLIDRHLVDRFNQPVGEVIDLIIDPRTTEIPLVLVDAMIRPGTPGPRRVPDAQPAKESPDQDRQTARKQAQDKQRYLLFPTASILLQADKQGRLKLTGDRSDAVMFKPAGPAQPLTRDWLVQRYLERKTLESWQKTVHIPPRNEKSGQQKHVGNYRLLRFTVLRGATINDANEQALGKIADLAIAVKHRRIPYAAITLAADTTGELIEAPLLGFVVEADKPWKIELPASLVKNSPRIDPEHWPTSISREWHASINARYDTDRRDGVEVRGPDVLPAAKAPGLAK